MTQLSSPAIFFSTSLSQRRPTEKDGVYAKETVHRRVYLLIGSLVFFPIRPSSQLINFYRVNFRCFFCDAVFLSFFFAVSFYRSNKNYLSRLMGVGGGGRLCVLLSLLHLISCQLTRTLRDLSNSVAHKNRF